MAGDLRAAILVCRDRALSAKEYGLATRYQVILELLERA